RPIARAEALRHDALQPHLAGVAEHDIAVLMLKMLVELHASPGLAQHRGERRLTDFERLASQIPPVEFEEVEGEQEHRAVSPRVRARIAKPGEARHTPPVAGDRLAVDQARADLESVYRFEDERIAW